MFKEFFNYVNGHKSLICSIALLIIKSNYAGSLIEDPELLELVEQIAWIAFGGAVSHKAKKKFFPGKNKEK